MAMDGRYITRSQGATYVHKWGGMTQGAMGSGEINESSEIITINLTIL